MDHELKEQIEMVHDQVCTALADPNRLFLLYLLGQGPKCVGDLYTELDLPQSTVSRHLKVLRDSSLVETHRKGSSIYYSLADERVIQALELLRGLLRDRVLRQARVVKAKEPQDNLIASSITD